MHIAMMLMMVNLKEGGEGDRERAGTLSAFPESFRACNNVIIVIIVDIFSSSSSVFSIARVTSAKSSIGIITHQGHISQVSANAESLSGHLANINSRASGNAKNW